MVRLRVYGLAVAHTMDKRISTVRGRHGRNAMKAVVLHEYGGPEKLKFEDNVPDPQVSGDTVLIAASAASVNPIDWKVLYYFEY